MPIYDGLNEINTIFDGNSEVQVVYDGTNEVWTNGKAIYIGYGKTFDIKEIYDKWEDVSIDDFFVSAYEGTLVSKAYRCQGWDGSSCHGCVDFSDSISFVKTYENGVLNCSFGGANVYVWLIPNSQKLIDSGRIIPLGTNTSFNVSSLKGYQQATKNNFLCRTLNYYQSSYTCCSYNCPNSLGFAKSYDPQTGQLVMSSWRDRSQGGGTPNTSPYYIPFIKD